MVDEEKEKSEQELAQDLIDALDKAIEEGPWEKGLLFESIGGRLRGLRDRLALELDIGESLVEEKTGPQGIQARREDQIEVFISLYNLDGMDMNKWEKILNSLGAQTASRPIYKHERDARAAIRGKEKKINEAYAMLYINANDIITPPDNIAPKDKHGHELILVKPSGLKAENVAGFMHKNGQYSFHKGKLIFLREQEHLDFL